MVSVFSLVSPYPPNLPLETRTLKGQVRGVLPNPLPSACLWVLPKLK